MGDAPHAQGQNEVIATAPPRFSGAYRILGVEAVVNSAGLLSAYREAVRRHHPDKGGDRHRFELVQKAYAVRFFFSVAELDAEYTMEYEMRRKACVS